MKNDTSHVESPDKSDEDHVYDEGESAEWGYNSAHMARATWQLPVRISIHADDMIHERTTSNDRGGDR